MTRDILMAALEGLEAQRARIEQQIAEVQALLVDAPEEAPARPVKHNLSRDGRARIAEAQKKRWTEFRKAKQGD